MASDNKAEALKTFVEQTKLLVTLASGFLIAPAAALPLLKSSTLSAAPLVSVRKLFFGAEFLLIGSILAGFFVLGSVAGSQHQGQFDVYRPATRLFSVFQLGMYLAGLICFVVLLGRTT